MKAKFKAVQSLANPDVYALWEATPDGWRFLCDVRHSEIDDAFRRLDGPRDVRYCPQDGTES